MVEIEVKITSGDLYDYNLRHTYTGLSGILSTAVGILGMALGIYNMVNGKFGTNILLVVVGAILIFYTPITLYLRTKQTYLLSPAFKKPLKYVLDDSGLTVSQDENSETKSWDEIYKAVSTNKSIIIYTSKINATIIPKKQVGDDLPLVIKEIATHLDPKKNKIRS